jgi:beta-N-acetylhexosaminidase
MPAATTRRRRWGRLLILLLACALAACAVNRPAGAPRPGGLAIVDRPIPFPAERVALTRAYIRAHYDRDVRDIRIVPRIIVLHWTGSESLEGDFRTFRPATLEGSRPELAGAGALNVSSHFLVDRDGTVYRLMPETWMARHVIGLNYNAIGIENVGGAGEEPDLTPAQVDADVALVRYLVRKHPTIHYLIGHHEYRVFEGHALWLERQPGYRTTKVDPGPAFMAAVRAGVADLRLKGPAEIQREGRAAAPAGT